MWHGPGCGSSWGRRPNWAAGLEPGSSAKGAIRDRNPNWAMGFGLGSSVGLNNWRPMVGCGARSGVAGRIGQRGSSRCRRPRWPAMCGTGRDVARTGGRRPSWEAGLEPGSSAMLRSGAGAEVVGQAGRRAAAAGKSSSWGGSSTKSRGRRQSRTIGQAGQWGSSRCRRPDWTAGCEPMASARLDNRSSWAAGLEL